MKEQKLSPSAEARNLKDLEAISGNLYLSAVVMAKRANQISQQMKEELSSKLSEFASDHDNLEEVHENREREGGPRTEETWYVSRHYEPRRKTW